MNAHAVNMKAQNAGKLLKGLCKVSLSLAIGIQSFRFMHNRHNSESNVDIEEKLTIAAVNIPNLYFFVSGCQDIHKALKRWNT